MALTMTRRVDADLIEEICGLHDDVYRNQWITYVYDALSRRLAALTSPSEARRNANWFTFARWSSFTVGENLRLDKPSLAFGKYVQRRWYLHPFAGPLVRVQHDLRAMGDATMPRVLAVGNRLVFHEIAYAVAEFLDWFDKEDGGDEEAWREFRDEIKASHASGMFRRADIEWMREGIECFWRAARTDDEKQQAEWILRGNLLLAAYEQWRLEPVVQIALDPVARRLVRFKGANPHDEDDDEDPGVVLRYHGTPWAFRHRSPIVQWATERYETWLTSSVMAWEGPIHGDVDSLFLGDGLPDPPDGRSLYPPLLEQLSALDTRTLVGEFDHSYNTQEGRRARNWTRYADRMNFIASLFRSQQSNQNLFEPLHNHELRLLGLDISDERLDALRGVGDPKVDDALEAHCRAGDHQPRSLVARLIRKEYPEHTDDLYGDGALPPWANREMLNEGRRFLGVHGLEIASALQYGSLPVSYTAAHGARVLTRSAELSSTHTSRRIAETGQMLLDVMADGGDALTPSTPGSHALRGVRLFHAAVRHMIRTDTTEWKTKKWGEPINQEDLLGTLSVFTIVALDGLERLGVPVNSARMRDQRDAYVHLWLVAGQLLGIDYALLRREPLPPDQPPLTYEELRLLKNAIFRRNAKVSAGGQILMASLLSSAEQAMPLRMKGYPAAATRRLIGNQYADMLGVPPSGVARVLVDMATFVTRNVTPRAPASKMAWLSHASTKHLYKNWIENNHGTTPPWRREVLAKHFKLRDVQSQGDRAVRLTREINLVASDGEESRAEHRSDLPDRRE